MGDLRVPLEIAGTTFSDYEFAWTWETSQLLARATGGSIREASDVSRMMKTSGAAGHPMVPFNGALLARNRDEVMDQLIGGYANWQQVGRWGSGLAKFFGAVPQAGRGRVSSRITEVGGTSKGHALVRFNFEVHDVSSGAQLLEGWMLMFLLGCAPEGAGALTPPRIAIPERAPDQVVAHDTDVNVTFDWAVPSGDWNTTHFVLAGGQPGAADTRPAKHGTGDFRMRAGPSQAAMSPGSRRSRSAACRRPTTRPSRPKRGSGKKATASSAGSWCRQPGG